MTLGGSTEPKVFHASLIHPGFLLPLLSWNSIKTIQNLNSTLIRCSERECMLWQKKDNKTIQQPHCGYNVALHCIELAHCITILGQFNGMVRYRHDCKLAKQFWQHFLRKTFHILRKCINSTQTSFWLTINNEKNIFRHLQCLYSVAIVETALPLDSVLVSELPRFAEEAVFTKSFGRVWLLLRVICHRLFRMFVKSHRHDQTCGQFEKPLQWKALRALAWRKIHVHNFLEFYFSNKCCSRLDIHIVKFYQPLCTILTKRPICAIGRFSSFFSLSSVVRWPLTTKVKHNI